MIIPSGFSQHTYLFSGPSLPFGAAVTIGVDHTGTSSIEQEGQDCRDAWITEVLPLQHVDVQLDGLFVKRGPNATGQSYLAPSTANGTTSGDAMSPNVTALVKKTTALGGRQGRGRMYVPGLIEANVGGGGALAGAFQGNLQDGIDAWAAACVIANCQPMLLHNDLLSPTEITAFAIDAKVATQRRRLRR